MKIGPRSPTLRNEEEFKIASLNGITVSIDLYFDRAITVSNSFVGKKLKKRLEDLERRAGSSSASPEQRHEELAEPEGGSPEASTLR